MDKIKETDVVDQKYDFQVVFNSGRDAGFTKMQFLNKEKINMYILGVTVLEKYFGKNYQ